MSQVKQVVHPKLGRGQLMGMSNGGTVWEVIFESGMRFRLPARDFETKLPPSPRQVVPLRRPTYSSLESSEAGLSAFHARQTVEALRVGIVPMNEVEALTIGLKVERTALARALSKTASEGGDAVAVIGDYGYGKSHFVELAARMALETNFLVASISLDLKEMPPSKPNEMYKGLVNAIRYPQTTAHGLGLLFAHALENPAILNQFIQESSETCPLAAVLRRLRDGGNTSQVEHNALVDWISGLEAPRIYTSKLPKLYRNGENARQYAYLLLRISRLATLVGYSGLAVLIDESEHYSLLRPNMRERADSFYQAMIYGAISDNGDRIDEVMIPQRVNANYPLAFDEPTNLFFLFALTAMVEDEKEKHKPMPVGAWLSQKQIIRLEDSYIHDDIQTFIQTLLKYHATAYGYPFEDRRSEDYDHLIGEGTKTLSYQLKQHNMNLREVIRTCVHLCDLLFLHADYAGAQMVGELRKGLGL